MPSAPNMAAMPADVRGAQHQGATARNAGLGAEDADGDRNHRVDARRERRQEAVRQREEEAGRACRSSRDFDYSLVDARAHTSQEVDHEVCVSRRCAGDRRHRRPDPVAARPSGRGGPEGRSAQARAAADDVPRPEPRARGAGAADGGGQRRLPPRGGAAGVPRDHVGLPVAGEPADRSSTPGRRRRSATWPARRGSGCRRATCRRPAWARCSARSGAGPSTAWSPSRRPPEGLVTHALDYFVDSDLLIVGEIVIEAAHALLTHTRDDRGDRAGLRAPGGGGALRGRAGRGGRATRR